MRNFEQVRKNLSKIAFREKIFTDDIAWGVAPKIKYSFAPGDVVEYTGYTMITTYDGAFSTYLKPGQLGVVVNVTNFGQGYLVSWEIGGGYMMTSPVKAENIKSVSGEIEKLHLEHDKRKDDILTKLVAPEHDIAQQSKKEIEKEFRAEPFGKPEAEIDIPGDAPETENPKIHFSPINKIPAMRYSASKNISYLKKNGRS